MAPRDCTPISIMRGTARGIINYDPKIMATEFRLSPGYNAIITVRPLV